MTNRTRRRLAASLALVAVLALVVARAGQWLVVDAPRQSDVILVLAGETDHRAARAVQLLDQGYGQRIVIDVPAAATTFTFKHVDLAEKYVRSLPEAASISICPIAGLSTRDESHETEKCLDRLHAGSVLIVTSDFHTRRALSTYQHELPARSFSVAAAHDDTQFGTRWWAHRQWAKTAVDEWLRLFWWTAVDRWR